MKNRLISSLLAAVMFGSVVTPIHAAEAVKDHSQTRGASVEYVNLSESAKSAITVDSDLKKHEKKIKEHETGSLESGTPSLTTPEATTEEPQFQTDEAPFRVLRGEDSVSTLSGGVEVRHVDAKLPGRGGLGFELTRIYDNNDAQLYGMGSGFQSSSEGTYSYPRSKSDTFARQRYPIGTGWRFDLPAVTDASIEATIATPSTGLYPKSYFLHWGGGSYRVHWSKIKPDGYPWQDLIYGGDHQVWSIREGRTYLFHQSGRLTEIQDQKGNYIRFRYTYNAFYKADLLTMVEDAAGNTITIEYTPSQVVITQGAHKITYLKQMAPGTNDREMLTEVRDQAGRRTVYDYAVKDASFNQFGGTNVSPGQNLNPYALLTGITHPTGGKTVYQYEDRPVGRYVLPSSKGWVQQYRLLAVEDRMQTTSGTWESKNRVNLSYVRDMGTSTHFELYDFSVTLDRGSSSTLYDYTRKYRKIRDAETSGSVQKITTYQHSSWLVGSERVISPEPTASTSYFLVGLKTSPVFSQYKSFDVYGNITSETDANGVKTTYEYDGTSHLLTAATQPLRADQFRKTEYLRDAQGNITHMMVKDQTGALLREERYGYDAYGNQVTADVTAGTRTIKRTYEYGPLYKSAFLTKQSIAVTDANGTVANVEQQHEYDPATGLRTRTIDGMGHSTSYQYDVLGRLVKKTNPDLSSVTATYQDTANQVIVTEETGRKTYVKWNPLGWKTESGTIVNGAAQVLERFGHDEYGREAWSEDGLARRTSFGYDGLNRKTSITYADGNELTIRFDDVNNTVTTTDADGSTIRETSDRTGRLLKKEWVPSSGAKVLEATTYDGDDNLLSSTDGNGNVTRYAYNAMSELVSVTDAMGKQTQYAYDMQGNLATVTHPDGKSMQKQYDELNRLIRKTDPLGQVETYFYDANGNRTTQIDRNGQTITNEYNSRDQPTRKSAGGDVVLYEYDTSGRRTKMTDSTGITLYAFNPMGDLASVGLPDGKSITYGYDANRNRTQLVDPFGRAVYYQYDNRNRVRGVALDQPTAAPEANFLYSKEGALNQIQMRNGVVSTFAVDELKRTTDLQQKRGSQILNTYAYEYDVAGNQTRKTENAVAQSFTYDPLNRIKTSTQFHEVYAYDDRSNRMTLETDQLPSMADAAYEYDAWNRLSKVTTGDGKVVAYTYNGDGMLYERTEGGVTTRYYYDGDQMIAEATVTNGVATLNARYIRNGARLVAREDASGQKAYYLHNSHGDVTELRDSNGSLLNSYTYDIWGNPLTSLENVENPFRYSGEYWDQTTSLQYLRARWYDPAQGRFLTEDTYEGKVEQTPSLNLYTYVLNNSLIYTDPTGHMNDDHLGGAKGSSGGGGGALYVVIDTILKGGAKIKDDATGLVKRIETQLDEDYSVIVRMDVGDKAHRLQSYGYNEPVDHINIEIHKRDKNKNKVVVNFHLIFEDNGNIRLKW